MCETKLVNPGVGKVVMGFAINSLFMASVLFAVFLGPFAGWLAVGFLCGVVANVLLFKGLSERFGWARGTWLVAAVVGTLSAAILVGVIWVAFNFL